MTFFGFLRRRYVDDGNDNLLIIGGQMREKSVLGDTLSRDLLSDGDTRSGILPGPPGLPGFMKMQPGFISKCQFPHPFYVEENVFQDQPDMGKFGRLISSGIELG